MTSSEKPQGPREFYLDVFEFASGRNWIDQQTSAPAGPYHVIEKSAFTELQDELKEANALAIGRKGELRLAVEIIHKLKSELAEAKRLFEEIKKTNVDGWDNVYLREKNTKYHKDLAAARAEIEAGKQIIKLLTDERDNLLRVYADRGNDVINLRAEIERLRAALERIAKQNDTDLDAPIAREALG